MDTIKDRFFALDARIKNLEDTLITLQKPMDETHLVSSDKEQGTIQLNEFDTFRFVRGSKWPITEYAKINGRWLHGMKCVSDIYFLTNPSIEVKDQFNLIAGQSINYSKYTICFKFSGTKDEFEESLCKHEIHDFYMFWYQGGPCYGKFKMSQGLRMAIRKKQFEIETIMIDNPSKHTAYDLLLKQYVDEMNFSATLTVVFKNTYLLLPHTSYFITPLNRPNIVVSLKSLTQKQAVFEFKYGIEHIPTDTTFHWMVNGMVEEKI